VTEFAAAAYGDRTAAAAPLHLLEQGGGRGRIADAVAGRRGNRAADTGKAKARRNHRRALVGTPWFDRFALSLFNLKGDVTK
jgi:hypothetical protein